MGKLPLPRLQLPLYALAAIGLSLTTISQTTIPSAAALPASAADTTRPGFLWRVHQVASSQPATLLRTEAQLSGSLVSPRHMLYR